VIHRVLRPGGLCVGIDSRAVVAILSGHEGDTFTPIDPDALPDRLRAIGFDDTTIDTTDFHFRFITRKVGA
jgi:hypothetical protein